MVFEGTEDKEVDPFGRQMKGKSSWRVWGKITGGKKWIDRWKTRAESHMKNVTKGQMRGREEKKKPWWWQDKNDDWIDDGWGKEQGHRVTVGKQKGKKWQRRWEKLKGREKSGEKANKSRWSRGRGKEKQMLKMAVGGITTRWQSDENTGDGSADGKWGEGKQENMMQWKWMDNLKQSKSHRRVRNSGQIMQIKPQTFILNEISDSWAAGNFVNIQ